jgi:diketogulonate reductase-like aldo/keto reductase
MRYMIALAWISAKGIIPILGPRSREKLDGNLGATSVDLTGDRIRRLNEVSAVSLGFPHEMAAAKGTRRSIAGAKLDLPDLPSALVA